MPIRILHMIGSLGIGVMNIYRKIDKNKIQFDFIIDHQNLNYYVPEIESLGGKVYYFPSFVGKNIKEIIFVWNDFFKEHPEYKILHSHVRSYASLYLPIAKMNGLITIIHSHSNSNGSGFKAVCKNILQYPLRYEADYFMACSRDAGEWLFGKKICQTEKFQIVKNAIDTKKYTFCEENRIVLRNEFGIKDEFVLGFLARVTEAKNPLFVIEIMKYLLVENPNAILLFVGDGELLDITKKKVKEYSIEDNVIFTGERSDVGKLLSAMDYYVLPSIWEGLGMSLIEAQASGIRCICSNAIQNEAIVTNLVKKCALESGAKVWAETIIKTKNKERSNEYQHIKNSGYDIEDNVKILMNFYLKLNDIWKGK